MKRVPSRASLALATVLLVGFAALTAPAAGATGSSHRGTIKVHDDMAAEPPTRNQPHVSCEFWVEGFKMSAAAGELVFTVWPPSSKDREAVLKANWEADRPDGMGHHFLAGPFELAPGHYRVDAFASAPGAMHDGDDRRHHGVKAKVFWVDECKDDGDGRCPPGVQAEALDDGAIQLTWESTLALNAFLVHRATADGDFAVVARLPGTTTAWVDTDTEVGVTYRYMVTGVVGALHVQTCTVLEVTAIPFFPSELGLGLASVGGVAAYAVMRRRP